jgi:hypothetical protein
MEGCRVSDDRRLTRGEHDAIQSVVGGVEHLARQMEDKWGVGRLELLVADELREKFRKQLRRFNDAITQQDVHQVRQTGAGMQRGWEALDKAATAADAEPLKEDMWEILLSDGRVVAFCRDNAHAYVTFRSGRLVDVWTPEEIARLIEKFPEIALAKQTFPGATVVSARSKQPPGIVDEGGEVGEFSDELKGELEC